MNKVRLPRVRPGDPIRPQDWNAMCDAIERCALHAVSGVEAHSSPMGTVLSVSGLQSLTATLAKVTTAITAASSSTVMGSGKIQRYQTLAVGTKTISSLTGTDEDCYNYNQDHGVKLNATVAVLKMYGQWFVIDVDKCTNLS